MLEVKYCKITVLNNLGKGAIPTNMTEGKSIVDHTGGSGRDDDPVD